MEDVPDIEGARNGLAYFNQNPPKLSQKPTQAELVSTRRELD